MNHVALSALAGNNPLGFLAALGTLDALSAKLPDVTLRWTDELVPYAMIGGAGDHESILDALDQDREEWNTSPLLSFPDDAPLTDAKPPGDQLRGWFEFTSADEDRAASDHLAALVAEGAFDGKNNAKPTHLHFTAGQQQFLRMVRTLAAEVNRDRLHEALWGPWKYDSPLPSFSWDARGDRMYAVRAANPSKEQRLGVPGADWLAFRGLVFYPVYRTVQGALHTTACDFPWKRSAFRWPLWSVPCSRDVVGSLVADQSLVSRTGPGRLKPADLAARKILAVLQSPIKRTDQGGYGSFGAADVLVSAPFDDEPDSGDRP